MRPFYFFFGLAFLQGKKEIYIITLEFKCLTALVEIYLSSKERHINNTTTETEKVRLLYLLTALINSQSVTLTFNLK